MSSDLRTQGVSIGFAPPPALGGEAEPAGFDRVMRTAGDPPAEIEFSKADLDVEPIPLTKKTKPPT